VATRVQPATALIALVLAISTTLALIGSDMHVEVQGYCDSSDDYMLYEGASSMVDSSAPSLSSSATGLVALISNEKRDIAVPYLVATLDQTYSFRERDGVKKLVDRPG
jgi:hypothetical protein